MARNQHYTQNTVSAAAWCNKCKRQTQHRVDVRRLGPCLDCIARLETEYQARKKARTEPVQGNLWEVKA
jgi:hypothetical protein